MIDFADDDMVFKAADEGYHGLKSEIELYSDDGLEGGASKEDGKTDSEQSYAKRPKITNTSRQDSQGGSEGESNKSN